MRFVDGQMTIEFKGNWTAFKTVSFLLDVLKYIFLLTVIVEDSDWKSGEVVLF